MTWSINKVARVLLVVSVLTAGIFSGASLVRAAEKVTSPAQGSWVLVSIYNDLDGKKTDVFGDNPRGALMLAPDGHFSMTFLRASLPKFAANARQKGTVEENQAVVQGSVAAIGTYTVTGDKEQTLNLHIEGSTYPNWDGQDQKRPITITGDDMKMINPTPSVGGGTNYVIWKRAK